MPLSRDTVAWAYRILLDRDAESDDVLLPKMRAYDTTRELRHDMVTSDEYHEKNRDFAHSNERNLVIKEIAEDLRLWIDLSDHAIGINILRGRYEVQLENEPEGSEPPERAMGSIYGRLGPKVKMPRKPGEWETFDVTLVGRTVTVVRDGTTTIDRQEIEGITGGALDANEGEPGPFYIQGDHTGGLKFRNVTVSVPKR